MSYNITKSKIEYKDNKITAITVFVKSKDGKIDKFYADINLRSGYLYLSQNIKYVTIDLLQEVAAFGIKI